MDHLSMSCPICMKVAFKHSTFSLRCYPIILSPQEIICILSEDVQKQHPTISSSKSQSHQQEICSKMMTDPLCSVATPPNISYHIYVQALPFHEKRCQINKKKIFLVSIRLQLSLVGQPILTCLFYNHVLQNLLFFMSSEFYFRIFL